MILVAVMFSLTACAGGEDDSAPADSAPVDSAPEDTAAGAGEDTEPPNTLPIAESDLDREMRRCAARGEEAKLTFQPSKQMIEGQPETVEAVATASGVQPPETLPGGELTRTLPVTLSCVVEASLVGPDFEIQPEGWQSRSFLETDKITWAWQVKPEVNGSALPLSLRLRAFVNAPGGREPIPIGPDDTIVSISVDAKPKSFGNRWSAFWSDPFWGSAGGLVVVLGGLTGAFRILKRRWPWKSLPPSAPNT